jgi:radical SAM superfamily enzyme YgiQ (UPF0313 family)
MSKIQVHPMAIGPDHEQAEIFTGFYALGCLVAYAKTHQAGELGERFDFSPITPVHARDIPDLLDRLPDDPGIFLLSNYVWNHDANIECARTIKDRWPGALTIVGGPHVPRMPGACDVFFARHPYIDVAVRHEGEITLADVLAAVQRSGVDPADMRSVDLSAIPGLTFRLNQDLVRTPDRERHLDLSMYPSPYIAGEFDHWIDGQAYMPVESNRGCPYGCTFCDWGAATLAKVARMSMERVLGDIEFAARHHVRVIGFCDANFGILPRDVDIVRHIIDVKSRYGYPSEVGYTNAKIAAPRLTELIKLMHDGGLSLTAQISMQTTDQQVLDNVQRSNIKLSEYRKMIAFFHKESIPTVSDMMVGLPGQTLETCKRDLQFCFDHKVVATIFATSVMPNAPMADPAYQAAFKIVVGEDGFVESTYSFTREDYARMFDLCLAYKLFIKLGLLKYLLYFVQVEHGLKAMDFIANWMKVTAERPDVYPVSSRVRRDLIDRDYRGRMKDWLMLVWGDAQAAFLFDSFELFQREILDMLDREHGVRLAGSDVEAVLAANRAVMPEKARPLPARVPLAHDVAGYFSELRTLACLDELPTPHVPLGRRAPGCLELSSEGARVSYQHADLGGVDLLGHWELVSDLRI